MTSLKVRLNEIAEIANVLHVAGLRARACGKRDQDHSASKRFGHFDGLPSMVSAWRLFQLCLSC
jgi:hypothetical protein